MAKRYHILILALLLTSCGPSGRVGYLYDIKTPPGREAIVFGRVKVVEKGEPLDWGFKWSRWWYFHIHILADAGPEPIPYSYSLNGDGSFYWTLPAGGYTITDFWWLSRPTGVMRIVRRVIFARFIVPEAPAPIYIGTLAIREEEGRYTIHVEDEYKQAFQRLKEKVPEVTEPVTKRLMQLKER